MSADVVEIGETSGDMGDGMKSPARELGENGAGEFRFKVRKS